MNQHKKQIKCSLIGDGGVGKTAYTLNRLNGAFEKRYIPTLGVEVHPINFTIMDGSNKVSEVVVNVWDCAGQERFGGLRDGYYIMSDVGIVMFSDLASFKSGLTRLRDLRHVVENIPVVFVWSKYDASTSSAIEEEVKAALPDECSLVRINTKEDFNCNEPFQELLCKVLKDKNVRIL